MKVFLNHLGTRFKSFAGFVRTHKTPVLLGLGLVLVAAVIAAAVLSSSSAPVTPGRATSSTTSSSVANNPGTVSGGDSTHANAAASADSTDSTTSTTSTIADCVGARYSCNGAASNIKPESDLYKVLQDKPETVKSLQFQNGTNAVTVTFNNKTTYTVYASDAFDLDNIRALAIKHDVPFASTAAPQANSGDNSVVGTVALVLVIMLLLALAVYALRRRATTLAAQQPGQSAGSTAQPSAPTGMFSRSASRNSDAPLVETIRFKDVIGQDDAKKALMGVVRYLKNPSRINKIGARIPRGVLLTGPGGLGKTLLARATAGEAGVQFLSMNGSDFMETYVGVGSQRVRALFAQARAFNAPCIIFIDEIDAIGAKRSRGAGEGGGSNDEQVRTLTALLAEMDGFKTNAHPHPIIVLAATNRGEALDPALLRAGRFTRKVKLTVPKLPDVIKLFQHYAGKLTLAADVDLEAIAKKAVGLPGASIENICNEAALMLADEGHEDDVTVTQAYLLAAVDKEIKQQISSSPAKRFAADENSIKLADVIGQQIAKEDVADIVAYLRDPVAFKARGTRMPKGTLFVGPPGEGKTLLARAVAGEAEVPFFTISGSDFVEMFVGVGAARVRELFEQAKLNAPSIIFIDEIDAIGKKRSMRAENSDSEREQTLNQLLVEMDGFGGDTEVIVLAATNRPDILDEALLRPGRFDRQATFYKPDYADRLPLLQYHFKGKVLADDVDLDHFAHNTAGFSGASIANLANEASLLQARDNAPAITALHIDDAITRVLIGAPRKSRLMGAKEKLNVAVHEGGHAVVYHVASEGEPIARITIMPRGDSGGHVQTLNDDQFMMTDKDILVRIAMALGGRAAQDIVLGVTDTGASSDFQQARRLAYLYVAEYGMSRLGPLTTIEGVERSPEEKRLIEVEVQAVLKQCETLARDIIVGNRANFDRLVEVLLEKETILGPEFAQIIAGGDTVPLVKPAVVEVEEDVCAVADVTPAVEVEIKAEAERGRRTITLPDFGRARSLAGALGGLRVPRLRKPRQERVGAGS
ncbi:MAG: AAA family ATPase [Cyanobacteria bacterium SZAS LIN-5]|nr:AAA family ATPase [Cyanobacteria bacterium SZAS LIN-5]